MSGPRVAAIIPHWNRRDLLETLLNNLGQQSRPFDQIIVVDNGSTDGSVELAAQAGASALRLERNFGFAFAVNRGIEACDADWVAILNNDVTLAPNWLDVLLRTAESQDAWFASGKLLRTGDPSIIDGTLTKSHGAPARAAAAQESLTPPFGTSRAGYASHP